MPVLMICNGLYSNANAIITQLKKESKYSLITDNDIIDRTAAVHKLKSATLQKVIQTRQIAFSDFTHEKEKCIAGFRQVVSDYLQTGNCIFHGILGHLIPERVSHVLRLLIITNKEIRIKNGMIQHGGSRKETLKAINHFDKHAILWTQEIIQRKAFEESLYDIVIPTDKLSDTQSVDLIEEHTKKFASLPSALVQKENEDFMLASEVEVALSGVGSKLEIESDDGNVTITINKNVMMLAKFKQKITRIARSIPGVKSVETRIGKQYYSDTIVRKLDIETPTRLLLVDDEKEFVQTLSQRLKLRQFPSEIAYDGKQALEITDKEETEVMILDLKMPGIDGIDVLKKIKETKPQIEVIILTGHGSEQDRKKCMDLGAFAYLQKPADIDLLTATMKEAYGKINAAKQASIDE